VKQLKNTFIFTKILIQNDPRSSNKSKQLKEKQQVQKNKFQMLQNGTKIQKTPNGSKHIKRNTILKQNKHQRVSNKTQNETTLMDS